MQLELIANTYLKKIVNSINNFFQFMYIRLMHKILISFLFKKIFNIKV